MSLLLKARIRRIMTTDETAWDARLFELLSGALQVWRVAASVTREDGACVVSPTDGGAPVFVRRITDDGAAPYWTVTKNAAPASDMDPALAALLAQSYAGVQGMLRAVRDALDPDAGAHRLVVGS